MTCRCLARSAGLLSACLCQGGWWELKIFNPCACVVLCLPGFSPRPFSKIKKGRRRKRGLALLGAPFSWASSSRRLSFLASLHADSAVLLVGHFECLLCHSPAFDLAYLSTSEVVPPSLVLHVKKPSINKRGSSIELSFFSAPASTPAGGGLFKTPPRGKRVKKVLIPWKGEFVSLGDSLR